MNFFASEQFDQSVAARPIDAPLQQASVEAWSKSAEIHRPEVDPKSLSEAGLPELELIDAQRKCPEEGVEDGNPAQPPRGNEQTLGDMVKNLPAEGQQRFFDTMGAAGQEMIAQANKNLRRYGGDLIHGDNKEFDNLAEEYEWYERRVAGMEARDPYDAIDQQLLERYRGYRDTLKNAVDANLKLMDLGNALKNNPADVSIEQLGKDLPPAEREFFAGHLEAAGKELKSDANKNLRRYGGDLIQGDDKKFDNLAEEYEWYSRRVAGMEARDGYDAVDKYRLERYKDYLATLKGAVDGTNQAIGVGQSLISQADILRTMT